MSVTRQSLYRLIDMVEDREYPALFYLLMKFVPSDAPLEDEKEALAVAAEQIRRGELFANGDIDWDSLDELAFD